MGFKECSEGQREAPTHIEEKAISQTGGTFWSGTISHEMGRPRDNFKGLEQTLDPRKIRRPCGGRNSREKKEAYRHTLIVVTVALYKRPGNHICHGKKEELKHVWDDVRASET